MSAVSIVCPACRTPYSPRETICNHCGLIFGSQPPPAASMSRPQVTVATSPAPPRCPACGRPARVGAKVCGACGTSLLFSYKPLKPGQALAQGRYTVQRALSKGGMSAIYLAHDHDAFDRPVVIKAMLDYFNPHDIQEVQAAKARFLYEARTLATLRHPAIPHIFTYFADGPHNYIVMEYVEGRDLEQGLTHEDDTTGRLIPGQPYHAKDVLRWGVALCRVLDYLATRQPHPVVHHDIKPANALLDGSSDDIRLVDFGTARARLLMQPGAGVGLQKSSIFGTQGYAPPEQYGGQSEPRSDVYALAATLYHLLTDDDPRSHPFDFPHLKELGTLGRILGGALHTDVRQRPAALALRQQLETLLVPTSTRAIQAPDGTNVTSEHELAAWCEQQWVQAAVWLYDNDKLPQQIERFWGKNKLANDLRWIVQVNAKDRDAGLDELIAQLDPHGFGMAQPQVSADRPLIDFGSLAADARGDRPLMLVNMGRRYVRAQLHLPGWITAKDSVIRLLPGQPTTLTLTADMQRVSGGGKLRGQVLVRNGSTVLARVEAQVEVSRWRTLWRLVTQPVVQPGATQAAAQGQAQPQAEVQAKPAAPAFARVAAATQAEAQSKLKPQPGPKPGTIMIRNRGGAAAWFTKAERQKFSRAIRRLGGEPVIEPVGVQCWNEFRVICKDRVSAVKVMAFLAEVNEAKKGVTQLDLEILSA